MLGNTYELCSAHRIKLLLCSILSLFCSEISGQQLVHEVYSSETGLPSSYVYSVAQDNDGYIWAITDYGVVRYNGETFTSYDMSNGFPDHGGFHIYKDKKGVLWFIPFNGRVCYFDGKTFKVPEYFIGQNFEPVVWMIEDTKGNLCFSTRNGLLLIYKEGKQISRIQVTNWPIINFEELKPNIYLAYERGLLKSINSATGKVVTVKNFFNNDSKANFARMKRLRNGKLIIANSEGLFEIREDLTVKKIVGFDEKKGFYSEVFNIFEDDEGNIWVPTRKGLVKFTCTFDLKKIKIYFKEKNILSVIKDTEKNIWLATHRGLIKVFSEGAFYYSDADGMHSSNTLQVFDAKQEGIIAIDYEGSMYRLHKNKITTLIKNPSMAIVSSKSVKDIGHNNLFIRTNVIAVVFNTTTKKFDVISDTGKMIFLLLQKKDTTFFVAKNGAGYIKNGKMVFYYTWNPANHFIKNFVAFEKDFEGNLLLGGQHGLIKITPSGKLIQMAGIHPACGTGVVELKISSDGVLWVATVSNSIYSIHNNKIKSYKLKYTPLNTRIRDITLSHDSILWVATNNGAYKLWVKKESAPTTIYHYNLQNALISNDVNCIVEREGLVYFATTKGISVVNETLYKVKNIQPRVFFSRVSLGEINALPSIGKKINAEYKNGILNLDFESAVYSWGKVIYKYKLEPLDTAWEHTTSNTIKYSSLPAGNYLVRIKATNQYGLESSLERQFAFTINKPYWQTFWFWILVIASAAGAVYLGVRYRLNQIRYEANLQKGLVEAQLKMLRLQMNPHFIFNTLQSIQDYIIAHQNMLAADYLSKFSKLIRKILDHSRHNFITLKEEIDMIRLYIELEKARFDGRLEYIEQLQDGLDLEDIQIPPMVVQPFIENAIKHGINPLKKGIVTVKISREKENPYIIFEITDTGVGRIAAKKSVEFVTELHHSSGIEQTQNRLNMLFLKYGLKESHITFTDLYANGQPTGTLVTIKTPIVT